MGTGFLEPHTPTAARYDCGMRHERNSATVLVAAILILASAYPVVYACLVRIQPLHSLSGEGTWRKPEKYLIGGDWAKSFFSQANWIDRQIRYDYWTLTEDEMEEEEW